MPRQARLDAPGVLHHVMIRGIERRKIFMDNRDRDDLVERLEALVPETHVSCYAWAFLPNHAHFLFRTGDVPLSTVMGRLLTGYAIYFNRRHRRHGPLFQNRYKSVICQEDVYLKELVRYIHLNPLRAPIILSLPQLDTYEYSGHSALLGKNKREWQDVKYVLSLFGRSVREGRKAYEAFVVEGLEQGRRPELVGGGLIRCLGGWTEIKKRRPEAGERLKSDQRILGDSEFVKEILAGAEEAYERHYELRRKGFDLQTIEQKVREIFGIDENEIYTGSRQKDIADARGLYCYWAVRDLGYPLADLARRLGMTGPGVGYAVRRGERIAKAQGRKLSVSA